MSVRSKFGLKPTAHRVCMYVCMYMYVWPPNCLPVLGNRHLGCKWHTALKDTEPEVVGPLPNGPVTLPMALARLYVYACMHVCVCMCMYVNLSNCIKGARGSTPSHPATAGSTCRPAHAARRCPGCRARRQNQEGLHQKMMMQHQKMATHRQAQQFH